MRSPNAISSLRASYPLTVNNLQRLYTEVLAFWRGEYGEAATIDFSTVKSDTSQSWVDARRAESMAVLLLSRIPGCYVSKAEPDSAFDFLLSFPSDGHSLAVEIKGVKHPPEKTFEIRYSRRDAAAIDRLGVPLLLLLIDVDKGNSFYGWIRPPIENARLLESASRTLDIPVTELKAGELQRLVTIKSTTQYVIHHIKGRFRMFISEHFDGTFYSTLWYYSKSASKKEGTLLSFEHKNFKGNSADQVRMKSLRWLAENLGDNYTIEPLDKLVADL